MLRSFRFQVLVQLDLLRRWKEITTYEQFGVRWLAKALRTKSRRRFQAYKNLVYLFPERLEEKVASLHLLALGPVLIAERIVVIRVPYWRFLLGNRCSS